MDDQGIKATAVVKYEKGSNYVEGHITGIHGGLSPNGLVVAYLFEDTINHPHEEKIGVNTKEQLISLEVRGDEGIKRLVKARITMDPREIPSIIDWFDRLYKQFNAGDNKNGT